MNDRLNQATNVGRERQRALRNPLTMKRCPPYWVAMIPVDKIVALAQKLSVDRAFAAFFVAFREALAGKTALPEIKTLHPRQLFRAKCNAH